MEIANESKTPTLTPKHHQMHFTGTGTEYFSIWIVNLALTIITFGIYSAWAKVRKNRYFYGNTKLDDESFEYHANPITILMGRIIAFAIFSVYYVITQAFPAASLPLVLILAIASPWLICRALAFNAINSSYRNIRFRFIAKYVEALKIIVGLWLLIILTLGILLPYYQAKRMRFIAEHHFYGKTRFNLDNFSIGAIYKIYGKASLLVLACVVIPILLIVWATYGQSFKDILRRDGVAFVFILMPVLLVFVYLLPLAYIRVKTFNILWNSLVLDGNRFISTLRVRDLYLIYLSNFLLVICTIGLATPWAMIRSARYKISHLQFVENKSIETFIAENTPKVGATGEAVSEIFDLDIGVG